MVKTVRLSMKGSHKTLVIKSAIISRLLLLSLSVLWRFLAEPYDTSASINHPCLRPNDVAGDSTRTASLENGIVWDGVYFVRIAQCGYEYEQTYAFLPLLPICIRFLSRTVFAPLVPMIGYRAVMALSGYAVSNLAFVFAAVYFYRLSVVILKDPQEALRATILFCFNPASIFYSSIYTESLYALFSIGGVYHLISGANSIAVFWFALSVCARSNGILNAGYICFQCMHQTYEALFLKKRLRSALQVLIAGAFRSVCVFVPFIAFQAYGYYNICHGRNPDEQRPWCKARIPLLYNFIQSHYWGVGFLRYFQLKQLPNFLLASPILSLAACSIVSYVRSQPELSLSLGLRAANEEKSAAAPLLFSLNSNPKSHLLPRPKKPSTNTENHNLRQRKQTNKDINTSTVPAEHEWPEKHGYYTAAVLPFIIHLGFMAATAFFVMHVQVATRFLSASPSLYWYSSSLMASPKFRKWGYMIWAYSAAYILLGSLLFSNFYPFT